MFDITTFRPIRAECLTMSNANVEKAARLKNCLKTGDKTGGA